MSKPSQHIHLRGVNIVQIDLQLQQTHALTLIYQSSVQ